MSLPTTPAPTPLVPNPQEFYVYSSGSNLSGQFGYGKVFDTFVYTPNNFVSARKLAIGYRHSIALGALVNGGLISTAGANDFGQLGLVGVDYVYNYPFFYSDIFGDGVDIFESVYAGYNTSFAITTGGKLWGWGDNTYGQLGIGSTNNFQLTPIQVPGNWLKVATGQYHTLALSAGPPDDDTLVVSGAFNFPDQSVNGIYRRNVFFFDTNIWAKIAPTSQLGAHFIAFDENAWILMDGNATGWFTGSSAIPPVSSAADSTAWVPSNNTWIAPTVTRRSIGLLYGAGDNVNGELGISTLPGSNPFFVPLLSGNFSDIATGNNCSFILSGGDMYCAGLNTYGQLGIGAASIILDWVFVPGVFGKISSNKNSANVQTLAIFKSLSVCGFNATNQLGITGNFNTFTDMGSTFDHVIAGDGFSLGLSSASLFGTGLFETSAYGHLTTVNDLTGYSVFTQVSGISAINGLEPEGAGINWSQLLGLSGNSFTATSPHANPAFPTTTTPAPTTPAPTTTPYPPVPIAGLATQYSSSFMFNSAFNAHQDFTLSFASMGTMNTSISALTGTFGWSVFFVQGSVSVLSGGGCGPDLGLISSTDGTYIEGIFLSTGFDKLGTFALSSHAHTTGIIPILSAGNAITVRYGATNTSTFFNFISSVVPSLSTIYAFDSNWRTIKLNVRRYMQEIDVLQAVGDTYTLLATIQTGIPIASVPATLKWGMSYSGNAPFYVRDLTMNYSL